MTAWIADARMRLDVFLAKTMPTLSRMKAGALVRSGAVRVNGRIIRKPAHAVKPGDRIEADRDAHPVSDTHITPEDLSLPVLYEDDACLVIDKPVGISVHPAPGMAQGTTTLLHGIAHLFASRGLPFGASSVLAHRLDRETTGCLLIAKTPEAHASLQKQFKSRTVEKTYLAIVAGVPTLPTATIDAPVGRNLIHRTRMSTLQTSVSREAQTTYHVLGSSRDASLLACDLHTGRTHQIRVHLRAIDHPILGDITYGSKRSEEITGKYQIHGLCLHAWKLAFTSPADGRRHTATAPLPTAFRRSLQALSLHSPPTPSPQP
jgi:23S rRNA pseudouridine1911/1915/1917 synthase